MAHKFSVLAVALAAAACIQQAGAELYISPVLREAAVIPANGPASTPYPAYNSAPARPTVSAAPVRPSGLVVSDKLPVKTSVQMAPSKPDAPLFGRDVPIKAAINILVPNPSSWTVVFEPGIESKKVSWSGVTNWKDALGQISRENGMIIGLNDNAKRIAVTYSAEMAKRLAQPGTSAWQLEAGKSLRENLLDWAKVAGWKIDWSNSQVDYPIDHSATLVGEFSGRGGVVDRVLSATQTRETALIATFYRGNRVVVVSEAGYKPEQTSFPDVDQSN